MTGMGVPDDFDMEAADFVVQGLCSPHITQLLRSSSDVEGVPGRGVPLRIRVLGLVEG